MIHLVTMLRPLLAVLLAGISLGTAAETSFDVAASDSGSKAPVRLYIANDDHTDFMWSADAQTYEKVFLELLDFYLQLADETAANPPPYRNRFNADGSYWLEVYERKKSPEEFARLVARLKDGTISAPLNALVSCYGAQPAEAVLRGMYYVGRLERKHGLYFTQAIAMENQGLPLGLASLWAGAGAKYSWRGICGCASRMNTLGWGARAHEIYWYTGHDDQRVLLKWHSLYSGGLPKGGVKHPNQLGGGYAEAFDPVVAVKFLDSDADFLSRYRAPGATEPYRVRAAFGFGWDALNRKTGKPYAINPEAYPQVDHFHVVAEKHSTSERQVIVSNQEDFFRDFEATYGKGLPAQSVTYGNEWDLYSASMSETSAQVKRAVEKLRAAEALAAFVSLKDSGFLDGRSAARNQAFTGLGLYWEHDWTADGPVPRTARAAWQESVARDITAYVESLHHDALEALGSLIKTGTRPRFLVFNPLGWIRTDVADFLYSGPEDVQVRDLSSGADVPHQFVTLAEQKHLRIVARDLPPVGYKAYEIRQGKGRDSLAPAATVSKDGTVFENSRVRLRVSADGAIHSLIDKTRPTYDFATTIGGLAINDFGPEDAPGQPISVVNSGAVSVTLLCRSKTPPAHQTAITLYRDSDRIELSNEIRTNFADVRHWAFSFNLKSPVVHTEEVGAIIRVKRQAENGDYAERNARYDYATLNHFADISDEASGGITLSSPDLSFVRLGQSTPTNLDTRTPQLRVLAGGQVDKDLGIVSQGGCNRFLQRFALRAHRGYHPTAAMKFAFEHQNPLVTTAITGTKACYPEREFSLLEVNHPDVLLWAVKPHEDGIAEGLIVRYWNLGPVSATARFTTPLDLCGAGLVSHIETPFQELALTRGELRRIVPKHRMETIRLNIARP
jgi:alpha-mannosidase